MGTFLRRQLRNKKSILRLTFCLSFQKKESKYNPMAGHHIPRSIALPKEELPLRRLNGPIDLCCGSLYSWWGSDPEKEVPDVPDTLTYLRVRVLNQPSVLLGITVVPML
jgi:hypothetical protein